MIYIIVYIYICMCMNIWLLLLYMTETSMKLWPLNMYEYNICHDAKYEYFGIMDSLKIVGAHVLRISIAHGWRTQRFGMCLRASTKVHVGVSSAAALIKRRSTITFSMTSVSKFLTNAASVSTLISLRVMR